jgi:AcrR family transcriptional regulator
MIESSLTPDRILDAAEDVLRRYGPAKATVVDVARALDVCHGTIYRHYPSKAALRDAVTERWLHRVSAPLAAIAQEEGPAIDRLRRWLDHLISFKRRKALDDPELFATYHALASEALGAVHAHVEELVGQLARIIESGVAQGAFDVADAQRAAKAVIQATARFHHPVHAAEWSDPNIDADFANVWRLVRAGLVHGGRAEER